MRASVQGQPQRWHRRPTSPCPVVGALADRELFDCLTVARGQHRGGETVAAHCFAREVSSAPSRNETSDDARADRPAELLA